MKINRLYIGDLGIYRNALMENISHKIVVIGGLNRSGKTTFLDILRYMPYGFPKNLRASAVEYFVECDLEDENKELISLRLNGLKEPQVISQDINRIILDKGLYGEVDKFTYSKLYTITLDELKRLSVKSEEEKLQAVLLGAGINDIVHIPKLLDSIRKDKEKIGGKNGNPNIKLFKPYYEKILSGIDAREEALKQVEIFELKEKEQVLINDEILNEEQKIEKIKEEALVLEVLENYFEDYRACIKMKSDLEILKEQKLNFDFNNLPPIERIEVLYEEYLEVYNAYNNGLNNDTSKNENYYIELLEFEDKIKFYVINISGLKQRLEEIFALENDLKILEEAILKEMINVNSEFNGDFNKVLNIQCDLINEDKLFLLSEEIRSIKEQKMQCTEALEAEKVQFDALNKELKSLKNNNANATLNNYLFTSLGILFISVVLYFVSMALASGFFITGITSAVLYYFIKQGNQNQINSSIINLKLQLKTIENKQTAFMQKLENINVKQKELNKEIRFYNESLNLNEEASPQAALQYLNDVKALKLKIINLRNLDDKIEKNKLGIKADLNGVITLISKFLNIPDHYEENAFRYSREIFQAVDLLDKELDKAKIQNNAKQKLTDADAKLLDRLKLEDCSKPLIYLIPELIKEYKIYNSINELQFKIQTLVKNISKGLSNERLSKALKALGKDLKLDDAYAFDYMNEMLKNYPVKIEIQKDIQALEDTLKESKIKLDALKEKLQINKVELNNLATSDKLVEAQRLIDEGRLNLKPLAIKYSVLSVAENILETVQKEFLYNAKHKLLNGAGEIFSKITGGEYKTVLPQDNLLQSDYKIEEAGGKIEESTSMLSRGTGEQLYLSVKLNRIKDNKLKLPIIFDDPFVNFDDIHIKNTLELISQLGEENQIFILTCHSEVIKHISDIRGDVQYWKLKKGKINLSSSEDLISHLTKI